MSSTTNNEQPVSKRQRIDGVTIFPQQNLGGDPVDEIINTNRNIPPDIISVSHSQRSKPDADGRRSVNEDDELIQNSPNEFLTCNGRNDEATANGDHNSTEPASPQPDRSSTDELDNVAMSSLRNDGNVIVSQGSAYPDLPKTPSTGANPSTIIRSSLNDTDIFQAFLMRQCLCGISDRTLGKTFECNQYYDLNGQRHEAVLSEWPAYQLIQYLSNIQLLTDVYLSQNAKGQICSQIMDIFGLIQRGGIIIEEILKLCDYNNKFVQFLAGRVVANCFVIAKDNQDSYENWLTALLSNLSVICVSSANPTYIDFTALRKINFSLDIILRILEWKDEEPTPEEPIDDDDVGGDRSGYADVNADNFTLPLIVPPIENNYFAVYYNNENSSSSAVGPSTHSTQPANYREAQGSSSSSYPQHPEIEQSTGQLDRPNGLPNAERSCHYHTLTDSESFDTTELKSNMVTALKNEWSRLVNRMNSVIYCLHSQNEIGSAESIIIIYLTLWERIISVQANLSVDSTLPFHEELPLVLKKILIEIPLPMAIYKQLLTLLNESLCYGTTLALQSSLPIETNTLANDIFNKVKNQQIFASLPIQPAQSTEEVTYALAGSVQAEQNSGASLAVQRPDSPASGDTKPMGHTLLQKLVLLILKSVAVTVKVLRHDDSSDSSMDGYSSTSSNDYEAFQEALQIERATRDVLKKLKRFMRTNLDHHPETHFSKMLIHLFADQDEYLIEAMLCTLDITAVFLARQPNYGATTTTTAAASRNHFNVLLGMLSPVYTFLEFLRLIEYKIDFLLDLLVSNETCFLLYLLRFLKYIRKDWQTFCDRCNDWLSASGGTGLSTLGQVASVDGTIPVLDRAMSVLTELRKLIERLVFQSLFPYDISPIIQLLRQCESLFEGNELF